MTAVRDSEISAQSMGINLARVKTTPSRYLLVLLDLLADYWPIK